MAPSTTTASTNGNENNNNNRRRSSLLGRLSSSFTSSFQSDGTSNEPNTSNNEIDQYPDAPVFLSQHEAGPAMGKIIVSALDDIPEESLIKLTRQLNFWTSKDATDDDPSSSPPPPSSLSTDQLIALTKKLVHAATWLSRANLTAPANDDDESSSSSRVVGSVVTTVPKIRFGRTNLQIPIVTCGGMRIMHTWMPDHVPLLSPPSKSSMTDSQRNLREVIRLCMKVGLNHFETARMYGTSELQFVDALCELMDEGEFRRQDFIFQTKVLAARNRAAFEKTFRLSWKHVQRLGYVDLFSFHVVSKDQDVDWVLDDSEDGCYSFVKEYQARGLIRHIGFSTHGTAATIFRLIDSNKFDFVNLHKHFFGSYHAEGTMPEGVVAVDGEDEQPPQHGNLVCLERARALDMGLFQISPLDKGGKLYQPTVDVVRAVGPELGNPMAFGVLHTWKTLGFHTCSVGLARVSDLDEVLDAAALVEVVDGGKRIRFKQAENTATTHHYDYDKILTRVEHDLQTLAVARWGRDWFDRGLLNLPSCYDPRTHGMALGHMLWLHNVCTAYGMYDFARARYANLEQVGQLWKDGMSWDDFLNAMPSGNSGREYVTTGTGRGSGGDVSKDNKFDLMEALQQHYDPDLVRTKLAEVHEWLGETEQSDHGHKNKKKKIPGLTPEERRRRGWVAAYDLSVWDDFPGVESNLTMKNVLLQNVTGGRLGINNKAQRRRSSVTSDSIRRSLRDSSSSS